MTEQAGQEWSVTPKLEAGTKVPIPAFTVWQNNENYSPDECFMVLGTGAANRLSAILNSAARDLKAAQEQLVDETLLREHYEGLFGEAQERIRELEAAARRYAYDACFECGEGECSKPFHAALLALLSSAAAQEAE